MSDFPIKKDALLQFDALSIKQHIKERLTEAGIFTDQNYEGSYISTIIDIISYTFNTLLFYLNRTSTESMFSDAQIYENMNRIVKMLDYKPIGHQSAILSFLMSVNNISPTNTKGTYTIPRYTYIDINGIPYSFNEDITFAKTTDETETLTELSKQKTLFQGKFIQFPMYTANGDENEIIYLTVGENVIIDHFNIHVYVKKANEGTWKQWAQTPSLYLENTESRKFELRLNENKYYEIKFGNGITGEKLDANDEVVVYYLESKGSAGEVGANNLDGKRLILFSNELFNTILIDDTANIIRPEQFLTSLDTIRLTNETPSTYSSVPETVDSIRQNAPGVFRSQYRLVTQNDYENYIRTNFANIIHDVKVVNNWSYLSEQLKYYYDLGISNPSDVSRAVYNQVMFADSCNFNNVYITIVPKSVDRTDERDQSMLTPSQKSLIIDSIRSNKVLTSETIIMDPVYMACSPVFPGTGIVGSIEDVNKTKLTFIQNPTSRRNTDSIKTEILDIFRAYFDRSNSKLGGEIRVNDITSDLLAISDIKTFYTARTDSDRRTEGLSMLVWNPVYENSDATVITQNTVLEYFKYPYLYDNENFLDKIEIVTSSRMYESIEY